MRVSIKIIIHLFIVIFGFSISVAQKVPLSHSVYEKWEKIVERQISNNGHYISYVIGSQASKRRLIIRSINGSYTKEIKEGYNLAFTQDSRFIIFSIDNSESKLTTGNEHLGILELGNSNLTTIANVSNSKVPKTGSGRWIAYQQEDKQLSSNTIIKLIARNLHTGSETSIESPEDYIFNDNGDALVIRTGPTEKSALIWLDLEKNRSDTILSNITDAKNIIFNRKGTKIFFAANSNLRSNSLKNTYSLYCYDIGKGKTNITLSNTNEVLKKYSIDPTGTIRLNSQENKIFFWLNLINLNTEFINKKSNTPLVNVWHYNDDILQSQQLYQIKQRGPKRYLAALDIETKKIQILSTKSDDEIDIHTELKNHTLSISTENHKIQQQWKLRDVETAYLISIDSGTRRFIAKRQWEPFGSFTISPRGKFIIWYDPENKNFFGHHIASNRTKNLTKDINIPLFDDEYDRPGNQPCFGIAAWANNDNHVLIYDRYDIWLIDLIGKKLPINITNGMGRQTQTILRIATTNTESFQSNSLIYLKAFNRNNKYSGFFSKKINGTEKPIKLCMGPYSYKFISKSKDYNIYTLERMSDKQSPDIYTTTDFRTFSQLSTTNPQQSQFNWLSAELIKWKNSDGKEAEGILYKPENFNEEKKYPLILHFYEKDSDLLYKYQFPEPSEGSINIPYFVSNDYLVFDPNIYYKNGEPGESAYNSVISAINHLSKLPYIDSTRIGIQGHSWGGYQVGYIITRTNRFAAAIECAGQVNLVSGYGGIRDDGRSREFQYENGQIRMGAPIWDIPDLYIKNSSIFYCDRIQTPLLIMHNEEDGAVPWSQAVEYFTALRRLKKRAWMLQYIGENHWLSNKENRMDFSIRMGQFFDHYLKKYPQPKWMKIGIPAEDRGVDLGLELE